MPYEVLCQNDIGRSVSVNVYASSDEEACKSGVREAEHLYGGQWWAVVAL